MKSEGYFFAIISPQNKNGLVNKTKLCYNRVVKANEIGEVLCLSHDKRRF